MKGLTIGFRVRIKICNHNLENTETSKIIKLMWHIMTSHHHVKMVLNEPQIFGYFPPNGIISIYWYFIHPFVSIHWCNVSAVNYIRCPQLLHYAKISQV